MENIQVGWINSSISKFISGLSDFLSGDITCLITRIDSNHHLINSAILLKFLDDAFIQYSFSNSAILLKSTALKPLNDNLKLFSGFDEIWFFQHFSETIEEPNYPLVGPTNLNEEIPEGLKEWLVSSDCILGLGDGIGLNYITTKPEIANLIQQRIS